jgi:beta-galactosidase/beta-glucuronidase
MAFAASFAALGQPIPRPAAARTVAEIASNWRFQIDVLDLGESEHWYANDFDRSAWAPAAVPKAWDLYSEALWGYEGIGWFATTIDGALARRDGVQRLKFGRVNYHSKVWLNGELLGENANGYLPYEFDLTGKLKPGAPNQLVLRVDNRPRLQWLPGAKQIEWVQYGGILEPVRLESTAKIYVSDLTIHAVPEGPGAIVDCAVELTSREEAEKEVALRLAVEGEPQSARLVRLKLAPGVKFTADVSLKLGRATWWFPESPFLYRLTASVEEGAVLDSVTSQFGVRKVEARGRQILINGRRFLVKGVNRYDEYGGYGPNPPRELLLSDLRRMKDAGVNLIRVHYPQSPELLSLYDEMGFAMIEEVPLNWWGNNFSGKGDEVQSESILEQAMPALERMIRRDKNHPAVIIWSMCNESQTSTDAGISVMRKMIARARQLDPSRLVTFVISPQEAKPHRAFEDADLVAVNVYHGSLSGKLARHIAELDELVTKPSAAFLQRQLDAFPNKPLLVTEFGARGVPGTRGDVIYTEDFQAACIRATWKAIESNEEVSGGVLWAWADYYHRRTFIQYAVFGPYGVVTVDRRPKLALRALADMYGGRPAGP